MFSFIYSMYTLHIPECTGTALHGSQLGLETCLALLGISSQTQVTVSYIEQSPLCSNVLLSPIQDTHIHRESKGHYGYILLVDNTHFKYLTKFNKYPFHIDIS